MPLEPHAPVLSRTLLAHARILQYRMHDAPKPVQAPRLALVTVTLQLYKCTWSLPCSIWAVYDGHGGAEVSSYLGRELHVRLQHQLCSGLTAAHQPSPQQPTPECREDVCSQEYDQDKGSGQGLRCCGVAAALRQAFADVDAEIAAATAAVERAASGGGPGALGADVEGGSSAPAAWDVGSTAVVAMVQWDRVARGGVSVPGGKEDTMEGTTGGGGATEGGGSATGGVGQAAASFRGGTLWVANLGNSRAVMCVRPGEVLYAASASGAPSPVGAAKGLAAARSGDPAAGLEGPNHTVAAGGGLGSARSVGTGNLRTEGDASGTAESAAERAARRRRAREAGGDAAAGSRAQRAGGPQQGPEEGHLRLLAVDLARVHEMVDEAELRRVEEAGGGGPPPTRPGGVYPGVAAPLAARTAVTRNPPIAQCMTVACAYSGPRTA